MSRIIVVSDDEKLVSLLKNGLSGYEVGGVRPDVAEIISQKPDLIMLEIAMPRGEGIILGLRIRQLIEAPILMFTTNNAREGTVRTFDPDIKSRDSFQENLTMSRLKLKIRRAIDQHVKESQR